MGKDRIESDSVTIRPATQDDFEAIWDIFHAVIQGGDTYVFAPDTSREDAYDYWFGPGVCSWVVEDRGWVLGMYKMIANQRDLGDHVANASFMVAPGQQGRGLGYLMGKHCLIEAKKAGFAAMQFNFVVSTNEPAVRLWKKLGFDIVGTLPGAFRHAQYGYTDVFVMFRGLADIPTITD
jgi:L-amino acid N-acyltransferase YncA